MGCRELQPNDYFKFVGDDKPESPFPRGNRKYKSIAEGFIITDYVDASGSVQAHYEYSPFGKIAKSNGAMEDDFDYRFSSEVFDGETGLVYYNYRYYSPELGRWLSRDPIGEKGGVNLYAMVGNGAVNGWDRGGLYVPPNVYPPYGPGAIPPTPTQIIDDFINSLNRGLTT